MSPAIRYSAAIDLIVCSCLTTLFCTIDRSRLKHLSNETTTGLAEKSQGEYEPNGHFGGVGRQEGLLWLAAPLSGQLGTGITPRRSGKQNKTDKRCCGGISLGNGISTSLAVIAMLKSAAGNTNCVKLCSCGSEGATMHACMPWGPASWWPVCVSSMTMRRSTHAPAQRRWPAKGRRAAARRWRTGN